MNRFNFTKNLLGKYDRMRLFVSFRSSGSMFSRGLLPPQHYCNSLLVTRYHCVVRFSLNEINERASNEIVNCIIPIFSQATHKISESPESIYFVHSYCFFSMNLLRELLVLLLFLFLLFQYNRVCGFSLLLWI